VVWTYGAENRDWMINDGPGPGNLDDPDKVALPDNVRSYAAVVQQDERRKIFRLAPINADDAAGFKIRFYYMPGGHSCAMFRTKPTLAQLELFLFIDFW
jgi:hypothetical protein